VAQREIGGIEPAAEPVSGDHDQRAHKHRKREAKRRRDAERPPESLERFRILAELVREGRQLVELADHKARYALIILGVLNAAVFLVITRAHLTGALSSAVRPWLISALAIYAVLTFLLMLHAIDCLRPRRIAADDLLQGRQSLLCWDAIARSDFVAFRAAWSAARMELINDEVVIAAHRESRIIDAKYRALGRLYAGLSTMVILGGVLLAVYAGAALVAGAE
jgi:hypothetical protein